MKFGAVTLVLVEAIFWKLRAEVTHHPIARYLRNHARGRDGQAVTVTIDNCGLRKWKRKNRKAVNQDVLWRQRQGGERDSHCFMGRPQNIDAINFEMIDDSDTPGDFGI